jgi:hypothetical protein
VLIRSIEPDSSYRRALDPERHADAMATLLVKRQDLFEAPSMTRSMAATMCCSNGSRTCRFLYGLDSHELTPQEPTRRPPRETSLNTVPSMERAGARLV